MGWEDDLGYWMRSSVKDVRKRSTRFPGRSNPGTKRLLVAVLADVREGWPEPLFRQITRGSGRLSVEVLAGSQRVTRIGNSARFATVVETAETPRGSIADKLAYAREMGPWVKREWQNGANGLVVVVDSADLIGSIDNLPNTAWVLVDAVGVVEVTTD